ncbi:DUF4262 domain-containing protein [Streptomyces sp. E1N211]|uniref:DUF4262 domain-containing protein n=1 Tax=Streptomyces sp. E1N211 TaxID=1851876 RepID=UPI0018C1F415|nr:DUF4262 domain-containing protein [Streptomyces sp. E1N211]
MSTDTARLSSCVLAETPPHAVMHVWDPAHVTPPYTYTIGLADRPGRAYELAVSGLPYPLADDVLDCAMAQLEEDDLTPVDGLLLDRVLRGHLARLRPVTDTGRFRGLAPATPLWQVLMPDHAGRFPGEDHYVQGDSRDTQLVL